MLFFKKTQVDLDNALLKAAGAHKFDKVKKLLVEGANLRARDEQGNTILHYIAAYCPKWRYTSSHPWGLSNQKNITNFMSFLRVAKFDFNVFNNSGQNATFSVVNEKRRYDGPVHDMMSILYQTGVKMDWPDSLGRMPAHYAAYHGLRNTFDTWLIAQNRTADKSGKYPADMAIAGGHYACGMDLRSKMQEADEQDRKNAVRKAEEEAEAEKRAALAVATFLMPAPPPPPPPVVRADEKWLLSLVEQEVMHVVRQAEISYKLTEIFNFRRRTYTYALQNIDTKADSGAVKSFDDFPDKTMFEDAFDEFVKLGGKGDKAAKAAIQGPIKIKKLEPGT